MRFFQKTPTPPALVHTRVPDTPAFIGAEWGKAAAPSSEFGAAPNVPVATLLSMLADAHVAACIANRQNAVLCRPVEILGGNEIARARLRAWDDRLPAVLRGALDALVTGWAVGEYIPGGAGEGIGLREISLGGLREISLGGLREIRWHDVRRFGRTASGDLILRDGVKPVPLPPERFLVYIHNPRWRDAYGRSDLLPAVGAWRRKTRKLALWMAALERHGLPTPVATVPAHWGAERRQQLADALGGVAWDGALVVEEGVRIALPLDETSAHAAQSFADAVEMENREISRALLGQELTTQSSGQGGGLGGKSLALARVQESVSERNDDALARAIRAGVLCPLAEVLQADIAPDERAAWGFV